MFVFSDSRLTWFGEELNVSTWAYYPTGGANDDEVFNSDDFKAQEEGKDSRCYTTNETPTPYKNGKQMNYVGGMCGYKY